MFKIYEAKSYACRPLSWDHPEWDNLADPTDPNASLTLKSLQVRKMQDLQYSDLHGVSCLLILCEKGRMGDTFPQTFGCLDLRIRTAVNASSFVQELGRLCRYPSAPVPAKGQVASPGNVGLLAAPEAMSRLSAAMLRAGDLSAAKIIQQGLLIRVLRFCNQWDNERLFPGTQPASKLRHHATERVLKLCHDSQR